MDPLTFIVKMIGVTAPIGAAFALGAGLLLILRRMNVEPFMSIGASTFGTILVAGIIGACIVVVEFIIAIRDVAKAFMATKIERWRKPIINGTDADGRRRWASSGFIPARCSK